MESEHKQLTILRCKCVVVGDACTGKTALTQVFNSGGNTYPKNYVMVCIISIALSILIVGFVLDVLIYRTPSVMCCCRPLGPSFL